MVEESSRAGVHTPVALAVVADRAAVRSIRTVDTVDSILVSGSNHQHKLAVVHMVAGDTVVVDTVVVDTVVVDMVVVDTVVVDTVVVGVVVVDMDTAVSVGIAVGRLGREVVAPLDGRVGPRY